MMRQEIGGQEGRGQTPLEVYLREIDKTPLLSSKEERALAVRIHEGDEAARDQLARANLRLVVKIAHSFAGRGVSFEDLIEEGNLGLLRAVEGFDSTMNTRFSTYASPWICQSMARALERTARTIRLPNHVARLLRDWQRARAALQQELGRSPVEEEVSAALGFSKRKLNLIRKAHRVLRLAGRGSPADEEQSLEKILVNHNVARPENHLLSQEACGQAVHLLDRLQDREATVLRLRYGLSGEEPKTLAGVGDLLGLTRERIRQIETEALRKLREMWPADGEEEATSSGD
jgi:RNA polymerase primary sigma factor